MSRPVRVGATVDDDIAAQLDADEASVFWRYDLASALALMSRDGVWESLPAHGGGRRMTVEGITVGARGRARGFRSGHRGRWQHLYDG